MRDDDDVHGDGKKSFATVGWICILGGDYKEYRSVCMRMYMDKDLVE